MRVDFIIDGEAVAATSGATFTRKDPVTGAVASEAAAASEADVAKVGRSRRTARSRPGRSPARASGARCCSRRRISLRPEPLTFPGR